MTSNYTYDQIYELTQVTQGANTTESYTYDPVGNRLSSQGVALYSYNNSNELTSTSNATYTYDNNGNTLTKTDSIGTTTYAWDFENRLTSVTLPTHAVLACVGVVKRHVRKKSRAPAEGLNVEPRSSARHFCLTATATIPA